ncbi:MAG: Gfo/Idh/MocA family protein [Promethearchaeota archaeon]
MKKLSGIVIGAGNRGADAYASYALAFPKELKIVSVAEPNPIRRENLAVSHKIPKNYEYNDWKEILEQPKFADIAIITTQDKMHYEPAIKAMKQGYHVLLEKPMATTEAECRNLAKTSEEAGVILQICHVLRYTKLFSTLKEIIDSGKLGEIININYSINLSHWIYAHSFVRGSWRNQLETSPMILAKACHDFDILYWFAGADPLKISSFARTSYLTSENRPEGATERCTDGCPYSNRCHYNAIDSYLKTVQFHNDLIQTEKKMIRWFIKLWKNHPKIANLLIPQFRKNTPYRGWPINTISEDLSDEGIMKALKEGPYGRCVYDCDNDQPSAQITNIEFSNQIVATLTMHGHSYKEGRFIRIDGTKASLIGEFTLMGMPITLYNHLTGKSIHYKIKLTKNPHEYEDYPLIRRFLAAVRGEEKPLTSARESLQSHLMSFAADRSFKEEKIIHIKN